jgi:hypothetical protein
VPARPPEAREPAFDKLVYVAAAASYVALGSLEKALLNWVIGPLWLVGFVWAAHRIRDRRERQAR